MKSVALLTLFAGIVLAISLHTASLFYDVEKVTFTIKANWKTQADHLNVSSVNLCELLKDEKAESICSYLSDFRVLRLENEGAEKITVWKVKANSELLLLLRVNGSSVDASSCRIKDGEVEVNLPIYPGDNVFVALKTDCSEEAVFLMEDFSRKTWRCSVES